MAKRSRRFAATTAVAALGLALVAGAQWYEAGNAAPRSVARTAAQAAASPSIPGGTPDEIVGLAVAPAWYFTVVQFLDPYTGKVTRPAEPEPGTRYVAAEVMLANASDQPLDFSSSDVRLRDQNGAEYPAGSVTGSEPRLASQNLPGGDWTRGWIWFMIPEDAQPAQLVFVAPPPLMRVPLLP